MDKTTLSCSLDSKIRKCPYCRSSHLHSKGYYKKKYRLPFNHSNIKIVLLKIKRFKCQECHDSFSNSIGLTPRNFTIPYSTIDSIMENLKKSNETFKSTAEHFSVSETTVKRYFDKYYHPDKFNLPSVLCFDEVYIPSLNISSNYLTVMYDFEKKRLIEVISSRKKADLHRYFYHLNEKEKEDEYILFNAYDDLPERKLLEIDYYINNFLKSGLPELVQFGKLLARWKVEICNSFTRIDGIRISNAFTEASNGTIKDIIRNAKGMHSFERCRNRMMYVINKDNWILRD